MRLRFLSFGLGLFAVAALMIWAPPAMAQAAGAVRARITQAINEDNLVTLRGNTHPLARPQYDQGAAPDSLPMNRMLLVLKRGTQQEAALQTLLNQQQDKSSPNYHQWLTPTQFGQQFGPSDADIQTVTGWLQSHGFQVSRVSHGRTVIEFSGTAGQVREAFHTEIHSYIVNGEQHWANASDPQIPTALTPVVVGVNSLHNFPKKSLHQVAGLFSRSKATGQVKPLSASSANQAGASVKPAFSFPVPGCTPTGNTCYAVTPYDFATIYNVLPLWNKTPTAIDGTGQSIAIVGESDIDPQDVLNFRTLFDLPTTPIANYLQIIVNGADPGFDPGGDETESDLDVEWSGAVAKGATIKFVTSASTNTEQGIDLSALYIVDNDTAPILSESYGACELSLGAGGNQFYSAVWEQAAAEGITVVISAGDGGSADCDGDAGDYYAVEGLSVSGLASTPFNVAVGGTDFLYPDNDPTPYWSNSNNGNQSSVNPSGPGAYPGYIPETTWNDSCTNPLSSLYVGVTFTTAEANCNDSTVDNEFLTVTGGGGGQSNCVISNGVQPSSCSAAYPKPIWQTALTPADGRRDLPDVSLFASNGMNGSFYIICEQDYNAVPDGNSCNVNAPYADFVGLGGTSSSAPDFAGIMALVNQSTSSTSIGQGNANYVLYRLAAQQPSVFNDVTTGTIAMPCLTNGPNCTTSTPGDALGVLSGYSAGAGYDLATGLGSLNVQNLLTYWSTAAGAAGFTPTATTLRLNNGNALTSLAHGTPIPVNIVVAPTTGSGAPTGDVSLLAEGVNAPLGSGIDVYTLVPGTVSSAVSGAAASSCTAASSSSSGEGAATCFLPGGTYSVLAHYAGDNTYAPSNSAPQTVTVTPEASATFLAVFYQTNTVGTPLSFTSTFYGVPITLRADVGTTRTNDDFYSYPTGSVTFEDNTSGAAIPGNPYPLNSIGTAITAYNSAPYGIATFSVGSHSIVAHYGGDASYNPSVSSASAFTITAAPTTTRVAPSASTITPGQPVTLTAEVQATYSSLGVPPTGTVTFFSGSTQLGTAVPITGGNDSFGNAFGTATLANAMLPTGTDAITAKFTSADSNYCSSSSCGSAAPSTSVFVGSAAISTTTTITPPSYTVAEGMPTTFTVGVTPNGNGPAMTGTVELVVDGVPYTETLVTAPQPWFGPLYLAPGAHTVSAAYLGDSHYAGSVSSSNATETATGPDFKITTSLGSGSLPISAPGASNSLTLTVEGMNGYNTTLFFSPSSCIITPAGSFSSCSFNPPSITGSGSTVVTIVTSGGASSMLAPHVYPPAWPNLWILVFGTALTGILLFAFPPKRRRWSTALGVLVFAFVVTFIGCGGGSSGGGGGSGGGNPVTPASTPVNVPFTVKIPATASGGLVTHDVTFTFTVQ